MPSYDEFVNMRSRAEAAEADRDRLMVELGAARNILTIVAKERDALAAGSGSSRRAQAAEIDPERVAKMFHNTYERLAPHYGYETREASRKPWSEVPDNNRALMVAVCAQLLDWLGRGAPGGRPVARAFLGEPLCDKPGCPCRGVEPERPVDLWFSIPPRTATSSGDVRAQDGRTSPDESATTPSSVIAVSNRFARVAADQESDVDWVRLRTGSGRQYEGFRSDTCPGDGVLGHRHDTRCIRLHASPNCACGVNDAGQRYVDPICQRLAP